MIVASLFFVGYSFRYFPKEILSEAVDANHTLERMKTLLKSFLLDENDEVRCQSFKTFSQIVAGLIEHCNLDLQKEFLVHFNDVASSENVNIVLNRILTSMSEWSNEIKELISQGKVSPSYLFNENVLTTIASGINTLLSFQMEGAIDPDVIGHLCLFNESLCEKLQSPEAKQRLDEKYKSFKVYPKISSKYVDYPEDLLTLFFNSYNLFFPNLFGCLLKMNDEVDLTCYEELIGSLAEMTNRLGNPMIKYCQNNIGMNNIFNIINNLYSLNDDTLDRNIVFYLGVLFMYSKENIFGDKLPQMFELLNSIYQRNPENDGIKDNCLAALIKLYCNPSFEDREKYVNSANILNQIESSIPLKGDIQEANYIWKFLIGMNLNENQILENPKMMTFVFETLINKTLTLDEPVFDFLITFVKNNQNNSNLQNLIHSLNERSKSKLLKIFV